MIRSVHCLAIALVTIVTFYGVATAQNIAVLGSPNDPIWNDDVREKLEGTGFFSNVDVYNISVVNPPLATLRKYCGVLVYSNGAGYNDPFTLGNNLADYVDAGGGVVVAVFANTSIPFFGRWDSDNYWTLLPGSQSQGFPLTLGTVHDPGSPLMSGVTSFNGGNSSYHNGDGGLHPNAVAVADWSNGRPLVLRREDLGGGRVDLNFFPPSNAEREDFWDQTTDGDLLMGNALVYVCGLATPVEATTWGRVKAIYTAN